MRSENIAESLEFIFMIWAIKTGNMVFLNTAKRKTQNIFVCSGLLTAFLTSFSHRLDR